MASTVSTRVFSGIRSLLMNREEVPDGIKKAQAQGGDGDFQGDGEGSEDNDAQAGHDAAEDPGPSTVSEFLT
jgi:hypothetical protein